MKRGKNDSAFLLRTKYFHSLLILVVLCIFLIAVELPKLLVPSALSSSEDGQNFITTNLEWMENEGQWTPEGSEFGEEEEFAADLLGEGQLEDDGISVAGNGNKRASNGMEIVTNVVISKEQEIDGSPHIRSSLNPNAGKGSFSVESGPSAIFIKYNATLNKSNGKGQVTGNRKRRSRRPGASTLRKAAQLAWKTGRKTWRELEAELVSHNAKIWPTNENKTMKSCPESVFLTGTEFQKAGYFMVFPCGMTIGSSVTIVGKPRPARVEYRLGKGDTYEPQEVSQFILELHGPKEAEREDPPRILHVNPRLKGDWSNKSVIELNTCYGGQWGRSQRCDGGSPLFHGETVDGLLKCEKWLQDFEDQDKLKTSWWLRRLVGQMERPIKWHYPFTEGHLFVLTIRAGWAGYHLSVDGRHISSFPYKMGIVDEEITGVSMTGDVDLQSIFVSALPSFHPKSLSEELFEASEHLKAPPLPNSTVDLFIGILSGSNNFAERMAVRKTWMKSRLITLSKVVVRFFVALHPSREINLQIKWEANYYGDMVVLPYMDHYDLIVFKTIAICEYAVQNVSARYILKCDDDTFVSLEAVMREVKITGFLENLYVGSINMYHKPLRTGKWAVTFEEWPEQVYPPYANGAGYIISQNIAKFIVAQNRRKSLELFKMEDVSMGLWVMRFNTTFSVKYVRTWRFCQNGCENGCVTAHYQSPRQMLCMWKKLSTTPAYCCM
eukprot:c22912_g1_i2 orf=457-2625(-)